MKMNRVIKFRAWQKYHKKMVEVTSISFDDNGEINGVATFVENQAPQRISYRGDLLGRFFLKDERGMVLELMQYTGLKDKNGVEIYEGDITTTDLSRPYLLVVFRNGSFMYQCHHDGEDYHDVMLFNKKDLDRDIYTEVIGNIYENPELLEVEV